MVTAPAFAPPDFNQLFTIEMDACSKGMGAILMQNGRPIAYISEAFGPRALLLSIYKKEYLAILKAAIKWGHYLEHDTLIIKMDHKPLKYLLEQKFSTQMQMKGVSKLSGLSYVIQYKKSQENKVTDALSGLHTKEEEECMGVSTAYLTG
ncbi:hypothetical protein COCNU_scaffold016266G000010 [Cocos nucifera]|nr:hypothetical protein [Cocos nucifera]